MQESRTSLSSWDYLVFSGLFVVSAGIGLFFAIHGRRKRDANDYLLGGRKMHALPVAFSLTAGFISAITVIGTPAEFYMFGTMFWFYCISYCIMAIVSSEIYIPLFYRLKITSTYEYLEMRFDRKVRILSTSIFIFNQTMYSGIAIYAPALALNEVTGLNLWVSVLVTGLVCTLYTSLGGLKAVVWTDVFQCIVMVVGFVAIISVGSSKVGGVQQVFNIATQRGRIDLNHFEGDLRIRHTFWSVLFGGTMFWTSTYGTTHTVVQRYLCCKSERHAKISVYLNTVGMVTIVTLAGWAGVTMFAYYAQCDPFTAEWVRATDQLTPYFVMEILHHFPGLSGVYLCSAFSGTLSTVSSAINAMAAVTLEDFIKPNLSLSQQKELWISKGLVSFYGCVCLAMVGVAANMGDVLGAALSLNGMILGPTLGLFTMGWGFPWVNSKGALCGAVGGLFATTWCVVGKFLYPVHNQYLRKKDLTIQGSTESAVGVMERPPIAEFYSLSYAYYPCLGFLVSLLVGNLVSFITGFQKPNQLPHGVTIAFFDHPLFAWLPEKVRHVLRYGIDYSRDSKDADDEINKRFELKADVTNEKRCVDDDSKEQCLINDVA